MNTPVQPIPYNGPLRRKIDKQPIPIDGEDWHSIIKRECEKITCLDDIEQILPMTDYRYFNRTEPTIPWWPAWVWYKEASSISRKMEPIEDEI